MKQYKGLIAGFLFALGIVAGAAVPTAITDTSSTAASNSPSGSENVFPNLDDYLRAHAKFIRDLYDGSLTLSNKTLASPVLTGQTTNALGSVSAPSYSFAGDTNTGLWSPAADTMAWSAGGSEIFRTDANGLLVKATARLASEALTVAKVGASYAVFDDGTVEGIYGTDGTTAIMGALSNHSAVIRTNNTAKLTVTNDGRVYGSALHNSAGAVTGTTNQYIASGTYTPTLTNTTNVAASTASAFQWIRVGNVFTASGAVNIDATAAGGVSSSIGISLPIASTTSNASNCAGTGISGTSGNQDIGRVYADTANNRAKVDWNAGNSSANDWAITFTCVVL